MASFFLKRESRGLKMTRNKTVRSRRMLPSVPRSDHPLHPCSQISETSRYSAPPNLDVHVVFVSCWQPLKRGPAIVKHSRCCARAGSTWKSPPKITSNVATNANWQTTENSLRLHSLSLWLENQYPLATAIATASNNVQLCQQPSDQTQIHRLKTGWQVLAVPQSNGPSRVTPARLLPHPQSNCGYRLSSPCSAGEKRAFHPLFRHHTLASSQRSRGM